MSPFLGEYDDEIVLTVSDWYHEQMQELIPKFMSRTNPTGAEPVPQAALLNDSQNLKIHIKRNSVYMVRVANIGAFAGQYIWFEGHDISVVELDGVYTQPKDTSMVYLSAGQRCSFLLKTKTESMINYPLVASMDTVRYLYYHSGCIELTTPPGTF
jgi:iron transport multicopper oxidase